MAVYKSQFKGSQIDNAVTIANANLNKGSADTPIYYDSEGLGQAVEKDSTVTNGSLKPLTSGGAYAGLTAVVDDSDIQYENFNGEFTVVGSVSIVDGVASGFSKDNVVETAAVIPNGTPKFTIFLKIVTGSNLSSQDIIIPLYNGKTGFFLQIENSDFTFYKVTNSTWVRIIESTGDFVSANTEYCLKISQDDEKVRLYAGTSFSNLSLIGQSSDLVIFASDFGTYAFQIGARRTAGTPFSGSFDLNAFKVYVNDKLVYTPYPNHALPPSQNAVKQYVDNGLPAKQDTLYGGYGIDVNGATVSVSDDVFREDEEARLHANLKVDHFGDMSVGNDSEVLELMNEARHSSFDRSKFTVNGTTGLTSDGVIPTGTSGGNYVAANYLLPIWNNNPWEIITPLYTIIYRTGSYWWDAKNLLHYYQSSDGVGLSYVGVNGSSTIKFTFGTKGNGSTVNVDAEMQRPAEPVQFRMVNTGSVYQLYSRINGIGEWTLLNSAEKTNTFTVTHTDKMNFNYFSSSPHYPDGSCDLKYLKMIDNGAEVFSGNKTGIDTIKADDYTTAGSIASAITDDGIMTPEALTDYVYKDLDLNITADDELRFVAEFKHLENAAQAEPFIIRPSTINVDDNGYTNSILMIISDNKFIVRPFGNSSLGTLNLGSTTNNFLNKTLILDYTIKGTSLTGRLCVDGSWIEGTPVTLSSAYTLTDGYIKIGGKCALNASLCKFSDNLNSIKIYKNGNIVYQPCLKIPYTLTKDGKKIVDSQYRSRVEDMYNQAGYTPYYTFNEGTNYTLATVEEDDVVSSYIDGANAYTQKANQELEIQGACTAETAVTFPNSKAFMDTNYALSIPYMSGTKTKTGFTPAIDGDYIAEGFTSL